MACKRLSEKIYLQDENLIKKYRPSIAKYSLNNLKLHILIYSSLSQLFLFLFLKDIAIFYSYLSLAFIFLFCEIVRVTGTSLVYTYWYDNSAIRSTPRIILYSTVKPGAAPAPV